MRENKVTHIFTSVHSPHANASERVIRSVFAAIRSYVNADQQNWNEHFSGICCGLNPFFTLEIEAIAAF